MMIENPMVYGLDGYYRRQDRSVELTEHGIDFLRTELMNALFRDPGEQVSTPGFSVASRRQHLPAGQVALGLLEDDEPILYEALRIIALAATGKFATDAKTAHELQLRASALIATMARAHADYHVGEWVQEQEDAP